MECTDDSVWYLTCGIQDMIDKLMNSDDPKWRNSKFLKFLQRITKGEIEFKDNQVVEKQGHVHV